MAPHLILVSDGWRANPRSARLRVRHPPKTSNEIGKLAKQGDGMVILLAAAIAYGVFAGTLVWALLRINTGMSNRK